MNNPRNGTHRGYRPPLLLRCIALLLAALALWWLIRRAPMPGFWVVAAVGLVLWAECAVALWRAKRKA